MPHLLGVDGNSVVHRAYHAGKDDPDRIDAWVTGIVMRMLALAWREGPFDGVVVGFDDEDNRRKATYPEYKAQRPDKEPDLEAHLAAVPRHLEGCGFTVVVADGCEADDVMAALAAESRARGWRASVLSSDRDLLPLVCDSVTLLQPRGSELARCTPARVRRDHAVSPHQYREYAALRGDPSDGLPGCPGIGAKTAARLLRDYGDLATLYASLPYLHTRVERALRQGRERVERNLEVMRPLPVDLDVDAVLRDGVDCDLVDLELGSLGLAPVAGRFRGAVERPPAPPAPPPPAGPSASLDLTAQATAPLRDIAVLAADEQVCLF